MGLSDVLGPEDKVQVKFSTFYELVKGCAERDIICNAVNCDVPHRYIREMITGEKDFERTLAMKADEEANDED